MSHEYIAYFISVSIILGYVLCDRLYQYYIDQYAIDVADILVILLCVVIAFIPYLNIGIAFTLVGYIIVKVIIWVFWYVMGLCSWLCDVIDLPYILQYQVFKSRRNRKILNELDNIKR